MKRIVLASASPRRRALLSALGIPFDVIPSKAVEQHKGSPEQMVLANARAKREEFACLKQAPNDRGSQGHARKTVGQNPYGNDGAVSH